MSTRLDLPSRKQAVPTLCACLAMISISSIARAEPPDYFIDEVTDYGHDCGSWDLNDVTSYLETMLEFDGHTGSRYTNPQVWAQDFWESCSSSFGTGGIDNSWADARRLAVFAGHGGYGDFYVGQSHNGACLVNLSSNMRLGQMNGAAAGYAMYITSCTMNDAYWVSHVNFQWLNQQFGYHNSPDVPDLAAGDFYERTFWQSNKDAWLDEMEWEPGYWFAVNSPVVVTHGTNQSDCGNKHENTKFAQGDWFWTSMSGGPTCENGPPSFWYCGTVRWHGDCI